MLFRSFIDTAKEVLKDEQAALDVVVAEYTGDEKAAYELGLQKLKKGVTKSLLFPYKGGTPEEMIFNAEMEFDIQEKPVQADLEAWALEMAADRKIGPATTPERILNEKDELKEDPVLVNRRHVRL